MESRRQALIRFLRDELAIPSADLELALQSPEPMPNLLPMILWQYGLVTITQLNRIFDWLEQYDDGMLHLAQTLPVMPC